MMDLEGNARDLFQVDNPLVGCLRTKETKIAGRCVKIRTRELANVVQECCYPVQLYLSAEMMLPDCEL